MNKKILLAIPVIAPLLASCVGTRHYDAKDYVIGVKWANPNEDFRILQLCDIHLSQSDIYEKHFKMIDATITDAHPNLIVLNGDSFTYADKSVVTKLFSFIDSYDIPWTFTFGNHDDQGYYADTYIQRILADKSLFPNAKFINNEDDDVTGRSNFAINIYQRLTDPGTGEVYTNNAFQVYCLESHSYNFDTIEYDYIKQDQIDWYERMVKHFEQVNGEVKPSAMYFHIPLPEFFEAWKEVQNGGGIHSSVLIKGTTDETGGGPLPTSDTHLFDKVAELGSTKAISCAHDHINDSVIMYDDVALCFGVHSTDRIYYDENKIGGQVIVVNHEKPEELTFENIYHTYAELEDK